MFIVVYVWGEQMEVADRIAVVTGASRGIGAAIARKFACIGYTTIGLHRSVSPESRTIEAELRAINAHNRMLLCDVSDRDNVAAVFDGLNGSIGAPTDLVNCAGVIADSSLALMSPAQWDSVVSANLTGVYNVTSRFTFPAMRAGFGVVTNITSIAGVYGNKGQTNYAATKAGIDGFTRSLAKEVGPSGIRANSVAPGFIATDMTAGFSEKQRKALARSVSLRRLGTPEDVSEVVAFLHSDGGGYITGQNIVVDGGAVI